jgi:hypothetical protein
LEQERLKHRLDFVAGPDVTAPVGVAFLVVDRHDRAAAVDLHQIDLRADTQAGRGEPEGAGEASREPLEVLVRVGEVTGGFIHHPVDVQAFSTSSPVESVR